MRLPRGYCAKEPVPENPVPLGRAVIPPKETGVSPKPQPWRVDSKQTTQSIVQDGQGHWILTAEANNGHRWEVDATEAVQAAVAHLRDEEMAEKSARIQQLEEENELARGWLTQYYEKYGDPDS